MSLIKVRAWNGKSMSDPFFPQLDDECPAGEEMVWMQFTGLFDAKGREICKGDILALPGMSNKVVEFTEHFYEDGTAHGYDGWEMASGTVVGNIYQHPKLLKP